MFKRRTLLGALFAAPMVPLAARGAEKPKVLTVVNPLPSGRVCWFQCNNQEDAGYGARMRAGLLLDHKSPILMATGELGQGKIAEWRDDSLYGMLVDRGIPFPTRILVAKTYQFIIIDADAFDLSPTPEGCPICLLAKRVITWPYGAVYIYSTKAPPTHAGFVHHYVVDSAREHIANARKFG